MKLKSRLLPLLLATALVSTSCERSQDEATMPEATADEESVVPDESGVVNVDQTQTTAVLPVEVPAFLDEAGIGTSRSEDGAVTATTTQIRRGSPIYASVRAKQAPAGLTARIVWTRESGEMLGQEQKLVPPTAKLVPFEAEGAEQWPPGRYRVEIWLGGDRVFHQPFTIVER